jgi:hypothetical protein
MKNYTAEQAAELLGIEYLTLLKQLKRDEEKPKSKRKYPHAHKCRVCGCGWVIPAKDLKPID